MTTILVNGVVKVEVIPLIICRGGCQRIFNRQSGNWEEPSGDNLIRFNSVINSVGSTYRLCPDCKHEKLQAQSPI